MKRDVSYFAPPGLDLGPERRLFTAGLVLSALYSLGFLFRYLNARADLFEYVGAERILRRGAVMTDMAELLGGALAGFFILALCMLALVARHYAYYRRGSRSIYLMRRLPSRWELHRRSLALPLAAAVLCVLCALCLLLFYYGLYMLATPGQCLAPGQWRRIWSVLL